MTPMGLSLGLGLGTSVLTSRRPEPIAPTALSGGKLKHFFNALNYATPELWSTNATTNPVTDGSLVGRWKDSQSAQFLSRAGGASFQPTFILNAGDGKPAVRGLSGTTAWLDWPLAAYNYNPAMILFVLKATSPLTQGRGMCRLGSGGPAYNYPSSPYANMILESIGCGSTATYNSNDLNRYGTGVVDADLTQWHVYSVETATDDWCNAINGKERFASLMHTTGWIGSGNAALFSSAAGAATWLGDIRAIIVCSPKPTAAELPGLMEWIRQNLCDYSELTPEVPDYPTFLSYPLGTRLRESYYHCPTQFFDQSRHRFSTVNDSGNATVIKVTGIGGDGFCGPLHGNGVHNKLKFEELIGNEEWREVTYPFARYTIPTGFAYRYTNDYTMGAALRCLDWYYCPEGEGVWLNKVHFIGLTGKNIEVMYARLWQVEARYTDYAAYNNAGTQLSTATISNAAGEVHLNANTATVIQRDPVTSDTIRWDFEWAAISGKSPDIFILGNSFGRKIYLRLTGLQGSTTGIDHYMRSAMSLSNAGSLPASVTPWDWASADSLWPATLEPLT